jgi:ketosteroid isomerase-like protein
VYAQVWTLRDGKVVRVTMYSGTADALNAAGLQAP